MATIEERMACNEEAIDGLKDWQERQNGSLDRIENKVDDLYKWIMYGFGGLTLAVVADIVLGRI